MIYELIFLKEEDSNSDDGEVEENDEQEPSKLDEMMEYAAVASLTAAASISNMLTQTSSSGDGPPGKPGQLRRALSRGDMKEKKKDVNLFGASISHLQSHDNNVSATSIIPASKRKVYIPVVNAGRTDRVLPAGSDGSTTAVKVHDPPSPSAIVTASPFITATPVLVPSARGRPVVVPVKLPLHPLGKMSPKVSPAASPRQYSPRGGKTSTDRSEGESTVQSRSSSGKSNKGDLLAIVERSFEKGGELDSYNESIVNSNTGKAKGGKPPIKGSKPTKVDKGKGDTLEIVDETANGSGRSSSGKSGKGELLSIVESSRERERDAENDSLESPSSKPPKVPKFPVMEKLELDAIDGYSTSTPRSRASSSRRQSHGELLVIFEGDDSGYNTEEDSERDRRDRFERPQTQQQKDETALPSLADRKKLRAELLAIMEGENDEARDDDDLSPRSESDEFDRGGGGLTPRIHYRGKTYTKGELLVIFEDDQSETECGNEVQIRDHERDRDHRTRDGRHMPSNFNIARPSEVDMHAERRIGTPKADLLTIVEGEKELDGKGEEDDEAGSCSPRAMISRPRSQDTQDTDDVRDGAPNSVGRQGQHRHSKGDLLAIFEDKDESEDKVKGRDHGRDRENNRGRMDQQERMERKRLRAELLAIMEGCDDESEDGEYSPRSDNQDIGMTDWVSSTPRNRNKHSAKGADLLVIVEEDGDKDNGRTEDDVAPSPRSTRGVSRSSSVDLGLDRITEDEEITNLDNSNLFQDLYVEPKTRTDVSSQSGHGLACIMEDNHDDLEPHDDEHDDEHVSEQKLTIAAISAHESRTSPEFLPLNSGVSLHTSSPPKSKDTLEPNTGHPTWTMQAQGRASAAARMNLQGPRVMDVKAQRELGLAVQRPISAPGREGVLKGSALDDDDTQSGRSGSGSRTEHRGMATLAAAGSTGPQRPSSGKVQLVSKKKLLGMSANPLNNSAGPVTFLPDNQNFNGYSPQRQLYQPPLQHQHQGQFQNQGLQQQYSPQPLFQQQQPYQQQYRPQYNVTSSSGAGNGHSSSPGPVKSNHMAYSINVMSNISNSLANQPSSK